MEISFELIGMILAVIGMMLTVGGVVVAIAVAWGKIAPRLKSLEEWKEKSQTNDRELYGRDATKGERLATLEERTKKM